MSLHRTRRGGLGGHGVRPRRGARRPCLQTEFCLYIDACTMRQVSSSLSILDLITKHTFLQQDALEQGVLIPQHQTLIRRASVALLQALQGLLIALDSSLELTDILCATLPESSLRLSIALLTFFGGGIYLEQCISRPSYYI